MGSARNRDEHHNIQCQGPQERAWIIEQHEGLARQRERDVLRQRACLQRKKTNLAATQQSSSVTGRREELEPTIAPREVSRARQAILTSIQTQLSALEGP